MTFATLNPSHPLVVATVHSDADFHHTDFASLASHCDILEMRLDGLSDELHSHLAKNPVDCPLPLLWTARTPEEGGLRAAWDWPQRWQTIQSCSTPGSMIDIECATLDNLDDDHATALRQWLQHGNHSLVASLHDFTGVPAAPTVDHACKVARHWSAACLKIAAQTETLDDVLALAGYMGVTNNQPPQALMGMGRLGRASRLLLAGAGSALNYGFLHTPTIPGQWPAQELKRLLADQS